MAPLSAVMSQGCRRSAVSAIEPQKVDNKKRQRQGEEVNKYTDARVGKFKKLKADKTIEDQSGCIGIGNLSDGSSRSGISEEHAPAVPENKFYPPDGMGSGKRCKLDAPSPSVIRSGKSFRIRIPVKRRDSPVGQAKGLTSTSAGACAPNESLCRTKPPNSSCVEAKLTNGTVNAESNKDSMFKTTNSAKFKTGTKNAEMGITSDAKLKAGTANDVKLKVYAKLNTRITNDAKLKVVTTNDLKLKAETTSDSKLRAGITNNQKLRAGTTSDVKLKKLTANGAGLERTAKLKVQTTNGVGAKARIANDAEAKAGNVNGTKLQVGTAKVDPKLKAGTANDPKFKTGVANNAKFIKMGGTNDAKLKTRTTLGPESKSGTTNSAKLKAETTPIAKPKAGTTNVGKLHNESNKPKQWVGRSDSLTEAQKVEISNESLYKALTQDWSAPPITFEREDLYDQDWLFGMKRKETVPVRTISEAAADASWSCKNGGYCNRARFIPEADVFTLPYTILL